MHVAVVALRPLMSGVGSRETGLDSLFASKPVGPGFEPCLGQSAKLAGAPKPLCLSVLPHMAQLYLMFIAATAPGARHMHMPLKAAACAAV